MKAARLYKPFDIRIDEVNQLKYSADDVLLKVKSVGICRSDIHYFHEGRIGDTEIKEPIILGHEFAGEILEIGKNIKDFKIGDRVAVEPSLSCGECEWCLNGNPNLCPTVKFCGTPPTNGALSEYYVANKKQLFRIPNSLSFDEGAALEPLGVAIHSVNLAKIKQNQNAAIVGTGSIGLLVLQLLKNKNIKDILAVDLFDYRLEKAILFGVDSTLNRASFSNKDELKSSIYESKFDIVFEVAGGDDSLQFSIDICKPGGKVILVGISSKNVISVNESSFRRKGITLKAVRRMKDTYPEAITLVLNKKIDLNSLITHKFNLEQSNEAFKLVDEYKDNVLKSIINP